MKIKTLICGLGQIGMTYDYKSNHIISHCKNIEHNKNFHLIGGVDKDYQKRMLFEKKYKKKSYSDIARAVNKTNPELIVFSLEIKKLSFLKKILTSKNLKFLVFEKPFLISNKDFSKLIKIIKSTNKIILVNFNRSYSKHYIDIKNILSKSTFGKLKFVKFYSSRNVLSNFSHFLFFLIDYLNKSISNIKKNDKNFNFISGKINFDLKEITNLNYFFFNLSLYFDKGLVRIYGPPDKIEIFKSSKDKIYNNQNNLKLLKKKDVPINYNEIYKFISLLKKKRKNNYSYKNLKKYLLLINKIVNI
tara:strand:+ start:1103 stop:2011 length:909 start_codon:yes stop_codon:yes gene_type:complete